MHDDPFWPYKLYDAPLQEFVDGDGPDAIIPVSSVDLLIYKDVYMEIEDCPKFNYHVCHLLSAFRCPSGDFSPPSSGQQSTQSNAKCKGSTLEMMEAVVRVKRVKSDVDVIDLTNEV
jgi:hypothetical protein